MKTIVKRYRKIEARLIRQSGKAFCFDGVWIPASQIIDNDGIEYVTNYWYLHKLDQMQKSRIKAFKSVEVLFMNGSYKIKYK